MAENAITEYRVPRLMWEALEASLNLAGKNYIRRIASILEVPEKELLKEVFKTNKVPVCIHDWTDEDLMCNTYIIQGLVKQPCPRAKICGSEFCTHHGPKNSLRKDDNLNENDNLQAVTRIACDGVEIPRDFWKKENNCVVNSKGKLVGYIKDDVAYLVTGVETPK